MICLTHVRVGVCLVVLCTVLAEKVEAQSAGATTAAIDGRVTDESSAALPGALVTATSPVLQGERTVVTNEGGAYRLPQLPPGDYTLTYQLQGFATLVRERQRLGVGFNATIDVQMQISTLEETLTVTGEAPVVDQRASRIVTNFDAEKLSSLPNARDLWSILGASPAVQLQRVDVGGSAAGTQTPYAAYDTKTDQHRPMVEGMVMTEGTGAAGFYYDYGSFEEVSVGTGSHSAEMGWPGVASAFVSKSGGNAYHGRVYVDYQTEGVQATNIDDSQIARGIQGGGGLDAQDTNRLNRYYDVNADVGGYIQKDKLWWYSSVRNQQIDVRYPNFPADIFTTKLHNVTGKATYTLSPNNKIVAYTQWGRKQQPNRLDTYLIGSSAAIHTTADSTWNQKYWGGVWKVDWNSVLNDLGFLELRAGQFAYDWPNHRNSDAPSIQDTGNNLIYGANREWALNRRRPQVHGALSLFKNGWVGSHNFKMGGEVFRETSEAIRGQPGASDPSGFPGDVLQRLNNGEPTEVYLFGAPTESINGLWTYASYLNDTWQPTNRMTLNLGLRYERYRSFLPAQQRLPGRFFTETLDFSAVEDVLTWNLWSPRVGVNFDLFGDGKTLVKVNYGQYWWNPGTGLASDVNTNSPDWFRRYAWADPNGSGLWEPGEEGTLLQSSGGEASTSLDPNLDDTYTREVAAWLEREIAANFGLRTGVVYRRIGNQYQQNNVNRPLSAYNVPVTVQDPGPDGDSRTPDDEGTFQAFDLSAAALELPTVDRTENVDGISEFWTWELSATRRLSGRWSMIAAFSYRWNYDFDDGYFGNTLRSETLPTTPTDLINTDEGRFNFQTWAFKLNGTYDGPWDLRFSPSYRYQSGQPFGRTFEVALNYGNQRILAEPIDTQRQDSINLIDLRVEKAITLVGARLTALIDLYNITNTNTEQNINWNSGTRYLFPSNIVGPRIVRFGVKFDW
ncbi:MAG: hypothetical protein GEV06_05335 [Luteitalea sp.]|nr:hypothetical protein [Luteitalea sp.]